VNGTTLDFPLSIYLSVRHLDYRAPRRWGCIDAALWRRLVQWREAKRQSRSRLTYSLRRSSEFPLQTQLCAQRSSCYRRIQSLTDRTTCSPQKSSRCPRLTRRTRFRARNVATRLHCVLHSTPYRYSRSGSCVARGTAAKQKPAPSSRADARARSPSARRGQVLEDADAVERPVGRDRFADDVVLGDRSPVAAVV
jgi:hypothetical protein